MESRVGLPRGTLLDSSYRIERVIGSGGFGITYEAEDTRLGTKVAIKEYYPTEFGQRDRSLSIQPTSERHKPTFNWGRSSFLEEARTLARFRHPSVVQVTRVFEANSTAYMVMIFEEGASFEAWLRNLGRPPTQEELDRIASPLLDALEIMHGQNFLHRDIAPDNIIIRANGTPVLLDFGAARRAVAEMSRALTGIVKTGYSPQEQYTTDGRRQGPWTDLYALGATLYRAVTGRPPEEATLRAMGDHMPSAANAAKGTYRNSFLSAVDACLEVAPTARPQSVAQLRPALFAMERPATVPVQDRRSRVTSVRSRAPIPVRPQTRRWPLAVAAILVLLGGVLGGIHYSRWSSGLKLGPVGELGQGAQTEAAAWSAVRDTTSIPALEAFIARFPDSFFAGRMRKHSNERILPKGRQRPKP
jgi:serine/threonine protein kinase